MAKTLLLWTLIKIGMWFIDYFVLTSFRPWKRHFWCSMDYLPFSVSPTSTTFLWCYHTGPFKSSSMKGTNTGNSRCRTGCKGGRFCCLLSVFSTAQWAALPFYQRDQLIHWVFFVLLFSKIRILIWDLFLQALRRTRDPLFVIGCWCARHCRCKTRINHPSLLKATRSNISEAHLIQARNSKPVTQAK